MLGDPEAPARMQCAPSSAPPRCPRAYISAAQRSPHGASRPRGRLAPLQGRSPLARSAPPAGSAPLTWIGRRKAAQQVPAGGSRGSMSAFPRRSGCALRRGAEAGQGWPRLPHRLRAGRGGAGAGIWVAWSGASRDAPGRPAGRRRRRAAPGGRAEVSRGARRGRRLSMPSPRAAGAGAALREGAGEGVKPAAPAAVGTTRGGGCRGPGGLLPGQRPGGRGPWKTGTLGRPVRAMPEEGWDARARCVPRFLPRELSRVKVWF